MDLSACIFLLFFIYAVLILQFQIKNDYKDR